MWSRPIWQIGPVNQNQTTIGELSQVRHSPRGQSHLNLRIVAMLARAWVQLCSETHSGERGYKVKPHS